MRKYVALFLIIALALALVAGCAQKEPDRTLTSRPVQAKNTGDTKTTVVTTSSADEPDEPVEPMAEEPPAERVVGEAFCEQLSSSDIAGVMGGTWSKTSDCPEHHQMPSGVKVCQCSYDGPKQIYVNVEVQDYVSDDEAQKVFGMYCDAGAESAGVGTQSCTRDRTSSATPNYVFVYMPNHFVKVSCLGGSCPFSQIIELAGMVEAEI